VGGGVREKNCLSHQSPPAAARLFLPPASARLGWLQKIRPRVDACISGNRPPTGRARYTRARCSRCRRVATRTAACIGHPHLSLRRRRHASPPSRHTSGRAPASFSTPGARSTNCCTHRQSRPLQLRVERHGRVAPAVGLVGTAVNHFSSRLVLCQQKTGPSRVRECVPPMRVCGMLCQFKEYRWSNSRVCGKQMQRGPWGMRAGVNGVGQHKFFFFHPPQKASTSQHRDAKKSTHTTHAHAHTHTFTLPWAPPHHPHSPAAALAPPPPAAPPRPEE